MTKVRFINISNDNDYRKPKIEFKALRLSKRDKEKLFPLWNEEKLKKTEILYPQTDRFGEDNEVFVRGLGYKKFGKTNMVVVPVYDMEIDNWDEYLNKYGKYCLFYSLSGYSLDDFDCCALSSQREFYSLLQCNGGIKKYQEYVDMILKIQEIQTNKLKEMFSYLYDWEIKQIIQEKLFRPCYSIMFMTMPPYLDTPADDDKLESIYRKKRYNDLKITHHLYKEYKELDILAQKEKEIESHSNDYEDLRDKMYLLKKEIRNDIVSVIDKEIEEGKVFPIYMSERMTLLFGEECNRLYDSILKEF